MKKILLFAGCVFATMSVLAGDALYNYDEGTKSYIYQGEPVSEFSVDFNTWATNALGAADWLDNTTAREAGNMAFVKFCINSRKIKHTPDATEETNTIMAFNNGTTNDPTPVRNEKYNDAPVTTNFPRIYLPTTVRGVDSIEVELSCNNAKTLNVFFKDEKNETWTAPKTQSLSANSGYVLTKTKMALNTTGATTIYLQYANNAYFYVKSIRLVLAKEVQEPVVSIDKHEAILYPGKEVQLTVDKVFPEDAQIAWTSSNEAVATVADGKVLGTGKGTAFIYATINGAKDSCKVTGEVYDYYELGADALFHYVGEPFEGEVLVLDFMQDLQASDVLYYEGNNFADRLLEWMDGMAGFYKWGYYDSRTIDNVAKGPLLWSNGNCENGGTKVIVSAGNTEKLPAIYFPTIKNGIKYMVVEGGIPGKNARSLFCDAEDAEGKWAAVNTIATSLGDKYFFTVAGNKWESDTLNINSADVKNIRVWRNSTDYLFINKITIVPMEEQPATGLFDQKAVAPAKKEMRNGQIVIRKNDSMYNILGAEVK